MILEKDAEGNIRAERYARNLPVIGIEGQERLLDARVAVVGLGGLGGSAVEWLARAGIGALHVADGDNFTPSNLNRQLNSHSLNLGCSKTSAACRRIRRINPGVRIRAFPHAGSESTFPAMIEGCHVVVDCLDSIQSRLELFGACCSAGVPFVHAGVSGFMGQVMTVFPGDQAWRKVFDAPLIRSDQGPAELGVLGPTAAFAASVQAAETIKLICRIGDLLRNKILWYDLAANIFEVVEL